MTGYTHPDYAESLAEFGTPRLLPRSSGWILERPIPGFPCTDGMGCYPLFTCENWSQLHLDLEDSCNDLVCLAVVADPFGEYDEEYLQHCFQDVVIPFKDHFITDLCRKCDAIPSAHHRYYARRALKHVTVEVLQDPSSFAPEWTRLYAGLIQRHGLKGIKAFSAGAFTRQLSVPGLIAFRAISQGETVGAHLWYVRGEVAYSHLTALSPSGYDQSASYALYWHALEYFTGKLRWLDLGAGAGAARDGAGGLTFFKRGWSTGTRPAYFCGRVFDRQRYHEIRKASAAPDDGYFPAYRRGELS
jgi:hypothetical protein